MEIEIPTDAMVKLMASRNRSSRDPVMVNLENALIKNRKLLVKEISTARRQRLYYRFKPFLHIDKQKDGRYYIWLDEQSPV